MDRDAMEYTEVDGRASEEELLEDASVGARGAARLHRVVQRRKAALVAHLGRGAQLEQCLYAHAMLALALALELALRTL